MNTRYFESVLELARTRNFNRAAENLYITQPALTYQINAVEEEIGFRIGQAAKEGLVGLTRSAAREMAGLGIRVNAVSPGFVESPMTANIPPAKMKDILRDIPVRRLGKPQDVANLVAFLASEGADYITGQVVSIDGGLFMG